MSWEKEKERLGEDITRRAYRMGLIETLDNPREEKYKNGWDLKGIGWTPYYINMRNTGSHADGPRLLYDIGYAMALMIKNEIAYKENLKLLGVDMAGIPLTAAISIAAEKELGLKIPYVYTRPLPTGKARTVDEAKEALKNLEKGNIYNKWGAHSLVEGFINKGEDFIISDDIATKIDSKLIARELFYYELRRRNIALNEVTCNKIIVVYDREQGAERICKDPLVNMELFAFVPFASKGIYWLKNDMHPEIFRLVVDFMKNQEAYQTPEKQKEAIEIASSIRKELFHS